MASAENAKPPRKLRLRYPATCVACGLALSRGAEAIWEPTTKTVKCLACAPSEARLAEDVAGASAAAEGNRRVNRRVEQVRREYGDHAAAVAGTLATREAEATWGKGSDGESRLAAWITREVDDVIALHDRLIPGTRGNIDHLYVARTGVWVVDAKAYKGKVTRRQVGPFWRGDNELIVGRRNHTKLARGVEHQLDAVIAAVRSDASLDTVAIFGALCFLESDWGLMDTPFNVGKIWITHPGALRKALKQKGPLPRETMEHVARRLDLSLPPATRK